MNIPPAYECSTCGEVFRPGRHYRVWWGIDRCADCVIANTRDRHGRYQSETARERDSHDPETSRPEAPQQGSPQASTPQAARPQPSSEAAEAEVTEA